LKYIRLLAQNKNVTGKRGRLGGRRVASFLDQRRRFPITKLTAQQSFDGL
jgi:hypothetical protein